MMMLTVLTDQAWSTASGTDA